MVQRELAAAARLLDEAVEAADGEPEEIADLLAPAQRLFAQLRGLTAPSDGRVAASARPSLGSPGLSAPTRSSVLRDAIGLGLAVGLYGAAFGAAADAAGLNLWQAMTMSALMFTGASQFALVGVLGAGGGALAAVGSALLLGTRNTVYGVRLVPLLRPRGVAPPAGRRRTGSSTRRRRCPSPPPTGRWPGWPSSPAAPRSS